MNQDRKTLDCLLHFMFLFPICTLTVCMVSLLVGSGISAFTLPISFFITAGIFYYSLPHRNNKYTVPALFSLFLILGIGVILEMIMVDVHYDSRAYHGPAFLAISDGWNPLYQWNISEWLPDPGLPTESSINHFPKAQWYISASIYALVGKIEVPKIMHLYCMIWAFLVSFRFLSRKNLGNIVSIVALSLVFALNPVSVVQLFSGYVDGILASGICILCILCIEYFETRQIKNLVYVCLCLPYFLNLKFTGIFILGIICGGMWLWDWIQTQHVDWPFLKATLSVGIISIIFFGFNPYVTNTIVHQNPFYPISLVSSSSSASIMSGGKGNPENQFLSKNRLSKLSISLFSRNGSEMMKPNFQLPFSTIKHGGGFGGRFGGFGPLYSGFLILGLILLIFGNPSLYSIVALLVLISVIVSPVGWWSRLSPQLWLVIPLLIVGNLNFDSVRSWKHLLASFIAIGLILNSLLVLTYILWVQGGAVKKYVNQVEIVKNEGKRIEMRDNSKGHFIYYNTRKLEEIGLSKQLIEQDCASGSKNYFFTICD